MLKLIVRTFMIRGIGASLSILMLIFLANAYNADVVGAYRYSMSFFVVISILCNLGFHRVVLRQFSSVSGTSTLNYPGNCFLACFLVSSIILCLIILVFELYFYIFGTRPVMAELSQYAFIASPLCLATVFVAYIKAQLKTALATFFESVVWQGMMLFMFIVVYLLAVELSIAVMVMIFFISWLLGMISSLIVTKIRTINMPALYQHMRYLCQAGIPCLLIDLVIFAQAPIIILILAALSDNKNVGLFAVAYQFILVFQFIEGVINNIYSPRLSSAYAMKDKKRLRDLVCCVSVWMYLTILPLAVLMYVVMDWVLLLFGEEFYSATPLISVLLLGQVFNVLSGPADTLLIMTDKMIAVQGASFLGLLTGLLFAIWLIPDYGALGASIGLVIIISISKILTFAIVKYNFGFWIYPSRQLFVK